MTYTLLDIVIVYAIGFYTGWLFYQRFHENATTDDGTNRTG